MQVADSIALAGSAPLVYIIAKDRPERTLDRIVAAAKAKGTAKTGPGGRAGKARTRKQAIAIGLQKLAKRKKVPAKKIMIGTESFSPPVMQRTISSVTALTPR